MAKKSLNPTYLYDAEIIRVVDGDTCDAVVDLGFYMKATIRFRLDGLDTPELRSKNKKERILAQAAKKFVQDFWGTLPCKASIMTTKGDKYGRWLATFYKGPTNLNQALLDSKLAKPYNGGKKPHWP